MSLIERSWCRLKEGAEINAVAVACSGGPDSFALLDLLRHLKEKENFRLRVFHVNYGLRAEESEGDAAAVLNYCTRHGIQCLLHTVTKEERDHRGGRGIQEWARALRFSWFESLLDEDEVVALAHHRDDLIETVLFRLLRGQAPGKLVGMREKEGKLWRPLLAATGQEVKAYAAGQDLPSRQDSSNVRLDYSRNRLRLAVIPELEKVHPGSMSGLLEFAEDVSDLSRFVRHHFADLASRETLPVEAVGRLPKGVALEVLAAFIEKKGGTALAVTKALLKEAYAAAKTGEFFWERQLPAGGSLRISKGVLSYKHKKMTPSSSRFPQHSVNLGRTLRATLAGDSSCEWGEGIRLQAKKVERSTFFAISRPSPQMPLQFKPKGKAWSLKELWNLWQIPESKQQEALVLYADEMPVGIWMDESLWRPGAHGEKSAVTDERVSLHSL